MTPFYDLMCWKDTARNGERGSTFEEFRRGIDTGSSRNLHQGGVSPIRAAAFAKSWNGVPEEEEHGQDWGEEKYEEEYQKEFQAGELELEDFDDPVAMYKALGEKATPMQILMYQRRRNQEKDWNEAAEELSLLRKGIKQDAELKLLHHTTGEARRFEREKIETYKHLEQTVCAKGRDGIMHHHLEKLAALPKWQRDQIVYQNSKCLPKQFMKHPNPAQDIVVLVAGQVKHKTVVRGRTVKGKSEESTTQTLGEAEREFRCLPTHPQNMGDRKSVV